MRIADHYKFLPIRDAMKAVNQKVSMMGIILEFGFPKRTRGTGKIPLRRFSLDTKRIKVSTLALSSSKFTFLFIYLFLDVVRMYKYLGCEIWLVQILTGNDESKAGLTAAT